MVVVVMMMPAGDTSVSTVSDYKLDDWGSISGRGKEFFL
jgi:hypothetical protein